MGGKQVFWELGVQVKCSDRERTGRHVSGREKKLAISSFWWGEIQL